MRILIFGAFIGHPLNLANALSKTDDVMVLLAMGDLEERVTKLIEGNYVIQTMGKGKTLRHPSFLYSYMRSWKRIREFKPDVVHIEMGGGWAYLAVLPILWRYPLVATFHDVQLHLGESNPICRIVRGIVRKRADVTVVHGQSLKEKMVAEYRIKTDRVFVVPLGSPESKAFVMHRRADTTEEGNVVLFFGWIAPYKGLEYLIKAEPLITKEVPDAKIVIAGRGQDFGRYRAMMTGREDRFVVINRYISEEEGAELFQKSSVVVLPYVEASQSGVIPLAYEFKKPVVVTRVGSLPEVVRDGETGYIVPPKDQKTLAEAILRLLRDEKLREEMGENGYRFLLSDMNWDDIVKKTKFVYERAIGRRQRQPHP